MVQSPVLFLGTVIACNDGMEDIRAERTFALNTMLPGAGYFYLNMPIKGLSHASVVIGALAFFAYYAAETVRKSFEYFSSSLEGGANASLGVPLEYLAASILVAYGTWLWSLFSSVERASAKESRTLDELSLFWGLLMSIVCPGSAQAYTRRFVLGRWIFFVFCLGTVLSLAAYHGLVADLKVLSSSGALASATPHTVGTLLAAPLARVHFSLGKLLERIARALGSFLLFSSIAASNVGFGLNRLLLDSAAAYMAPGAAHFSLGRSREGLAFFGLYCLLLIASFLRVQAGELPFGDAMKLVTYSSLIHYLYCRIVQGLCLHRMADCDKEEAC